MLAPLRFAGIRRAGVQVPVTAGVRSPNENAEHGENSRMGYFGVLAVPLVWKEAVSAVVWSVGRATDMRRHCCNCGPGSGAYGTTVDLQH